MGYLEDRVNWTAEEHKAANNADKIYEAVSEAVKNGIGPEDITAAAVVLGPSMALWHYLSSGSREDFASKLVDLGVMLKRDNLLLGEGVDQ